MNKGKDELDEIFVDKHPESVYFKKELIRRIKIIRTKYGLSIKSGTWEGIEETILKIK